MLNEALSDGHLSGESATGVVYGLGARQTFGTGIGAAWAYRGDDAADNVYMLVYLNGRFSRRLTGSARAASLIGGAYETHDVHVMPWRRDMEPPEEWYGSATGTRAHIVWERDTDTTITSYNVYRASTLAGTYTLLDSKTKLDVERGIFEMASGANCIVAGDYAGEGSHTNSLFTVTVTDPSLRMVEITNDKDAVVLTHNYQPGVSFPILDGIQITIEGSAATSDTVSFVVGVLPYYDTAPLADGTWYFKIASVDQVDNEAIHSAAFAINISGPPEPPQSFELSYNELTNTIVAAITQSTSAGVVAVNIYTNYCTDTDVLLDGIIYDWPLLSLSATAGQVLTNQSVLAATGKPAGTYRFVCRAVNADGHEDGAAVEATIALPYVPADLPKPFGILATPTAGGAVTISWYTQEPAPYDWRITGLTTDPLDVAIDPEERNGHYFYTTDIHASDVGVEGTYTAIIKAPNVDSSRFGPTGSIEFTTDATPPAQPTGLSGVAF